MLHGAANRSSIDIFDSEITFSGKTSTCLDNAYQSRASVVLPHKGGSKRVMVRQR